MEAADAHSPPKKTPTLDTATHQGGPKSPLHITVAPPPGAQLDLSFNDPNLTDPTTDPSLKPVRRSVGEKRCATTLIALTHTDREALKRR
jgi:hypothetical protein